VFTMVGIDMSTMMDIDMSATVVIDVSTMVRRQCAGQDHRHASSRARPIA
jgi:hypothetical protein